MKRIACTLLLLTAPLFAQARPADCVFVTDGKTIAKGPCDFQMHSSIPGDPKGSFRVFFSDGYFAIINITAPGKATASWNEEAWANHAHTDLGPVTLVKGCWQNQTSRICVWNPSRQSLSSRATPKQLIGTDADSYCKIQASRNPDGKLITEAYKECLTTMANTVRK